MIDDMRMRKLCDKTQTGYLRAVRQFAKYLGRSPDTATVEDLRNYQLYLVDHGISPVSLNAAITGRITSYNVCYTKLLRLCGNWWNMYFHGGDDRRHRG